METTKYKYRSLARVIMEAATPLSIGSGDKNIITDALILTDVNGLPYIPGTTLAGIIRHALKKETGDRLFGYQKTNSNEGRGSEIIFSTAQMVGEDLKIIEGIRPIDFNSEFYNHYKNLPIRQHVRINEKGTAQKRGKFDKQVIIKGTRFCFEIELLSDKALEDDIEFLEIGEILKSNAFRIGGGSRSGLGEINIVEFKMASIDLTNPDQLSTYINKTSSLNDPFWETCPTTECGQLKSQQWIEYKLILRPDDFFHFGSGFGNEVADMTPVKEPYIDWADGKPTVRKNNILIPGSSVKGALSHRVAFYYNLDNGLFADRTDTETKTGSDNPAVVSLFGSSNTDDPKRGNTLFSDLITTSTHKGKLLNHVSIDRFTGGAIEGALFTEEVSYEKDQIFELKILLEDKLEVKEYQPALERALKDICTGMLPLGGGVNRGNGCFCGKLIKNGKEI